MKSIKLTSKMYSDLSLMMRELGASDGDSAYPSHVYVNNSTFKKIEQAITKQYKKEYPYISDRKLQSSVGFHMLNLSPSTVEGSGLKDGYALVDDNAIKSEIKTNNNKSKGA